MGPDPEESFCMSVLVDKNRHIQGFLLHKLLDGFGLFFRVDAVKNQTPWIGTGYTVFARRDPPAGNLGTR